MRFVLLRGLATELTLSL